MTLRLTGRLLRVLLHLVRGLVICALVFPWLGREQRMARIGRWSAQLLTIFRVSVELAPGSCLPARGLWVANHVSWIDIFVINALFPSRFVAKSEVRQWPLVGTLCAWAGTIFIARANRRDLRHTMSQVVTALRTGERVVVFPEGTSCAQGDIRPFRANLFEAAIEAPAMVQPAAIIYFDNDGRIHRAVEYIGETSLIESMIAMLAGVPIRAVLHTTPALPAWAYGRRDLAQLAFDAVHAELTQQMVEAHDKQTMKA